MKSTVYYEARLKKNIKRTPYGVSTVYKKGTVVWDCSEKQFQKLTADNIHHQTSLGICEGHGVYEYFDLEDIEFFRVEKIVRLKERVVKFKK